MTGKRRRLLRGFALAGLAVGSALAVLLVFAEVAHRDGLESLDGLLAERRDVRFADDGRIKLLFLGDSFTAGELAESGVGFWAYLPDAVKAFGYTRGVQTVSLAMAGSSSPYHYRQLVEWLAESGQRPDFVFATTGANNNHGFVFQQHFIRHSGYAHELPLWVRGLYRLPRSLTWGIDQAALHLGLADFDDPTKVSFAPLIRHFKKSRAYMGWVNELIAEWVAALHRLGQRRGFRVLAASYVRTGFHAPLRREAARLGITLYDIESEGLEDCMRGWGYMTKDEWHPNDAGHKYLALRLARWLVREVLPGPGGQPAGRTAPGGPTLPRCTIQPRSYP